MRAAIAMLALALGGCTLFDDPPDRSCKINADCFQAQGEVCNVQTRQCEVPVDAGARETPEDGDEEIGELADEAVTP